MIYRCKSPTSILCGNTIKKFKNLTNFSCKIFLRNLLPVISPYSTVTKDQKNPSSTLRIPHWIDNSVVHQEIEEIKEEEHQQRNEILKNIRPFRLNQLSVFNPNPYNLSKPITKNPVLKHLWKLRVNTNYRKESNKRLVINANIVRHILSHTNTKFDIILTTNKELIDFVLSKPEYNSRYSRIQLIDKYALQYCLRGTTHSYKTVDTISEAYIPEPNEELSPKLVVALDNVKYPQNLGSIIRTSLALEVDLIYYLQGTTDPFNWKVSSITGGLQYALPYRKGEVKELRKFCKEKELVPVVAHLEGEPLDSVSLQGKGVCLILGNESEGPKEEITKFAKRVSLYMHPFTNSLNVSVAGAIILHQLKSKLVNK